MSNYKNNIIICYACGSDDTFLLRENASSNVFKCRSCGRLIVKMKHDRSGMRD